MTGIVLRTSIQMQFKLGDKTKDIIALTKWEHDFEFPIGDLGKATDIAYTTGRAEAPHVITELMKKGIDLREHQDEATAAMANIIGGVLSGVFRSVLTLNGIRYNCHYDISSQLYELMEGYSLAIGYRVTAVTDVGRA